MTRFHTPVLLKEVIEFLAPKEGGVYFDGTLGGGGYAEKILEASGPDGVLFGVDVDNDALVAAKKGLEKFGERAVIEKANYADVLNFADKRSLKFDGMVGDLGVSSHQLDLGARGFSFNSDAPLDMRVDKSGGETAGDVIRSCSCGELEEIFVKYGEEKFARRIAENVFEKKENIRTTLDLEKICWSAYPSKLRHGRIHPATRVFQALRIAVNGELDNLEKFIGDAPGVLRSGGRLVIVSYHSLEDRIVKLAFKGLAMGGGFKLLTKKIVGPSDDEIAANPRARSAKLRAISKGVVKNVLFGGWSKMSRC